MNGKGKFMLLFGHEFYIPRLWHKGEPDPDDKNFIRPSPKSNVTNVRPVATYYNFKAKIKRLREDEILFFRQISGKQIILIPHIDEFAIQYLVNVKKAEITFESKKPWKNVLNLELEGARNVTLMTAGVRSGFVTFKG